MPFAVDLERYTTIPTRTPALTLSLSRALIVAAAQPPAAPVATRLGRVEVCAKELQTAWIAAQRPVNKGTDVRELDIRDGRGWSVLRSRLHDWLELEHPDRGPRAAPILALLFPDGLGFVNRPAPEQWAEGARRLAMIDDDPELAAEIDALSDPEVMISIRRTHAAYGDAQAITRERAQQPDEASIHSLVQALRAELAGYARLILGLTDEHDDESVAAAEAQLEPILRFRALRDQRTSAAAENSVEYGEDAVEDVIEPIDAPVPPAPKP